MDSPAAGNAVQTLGAAMRFVGNLYISFFAVFTLAILHNISCFCTLHKFLVSFQYHREPRQIANLEGQRACFAPLRRCFALSPSKQSEAADKLDRLYSSDNYWNSIILVSRGKEKRQETHCFSAFCRFLVRITGLEPARRRHQILNLARLPIPPYPQIFSIRQKTETLKWISSI